MTQFTKYVIQKKKLIVTIAIATLAAFLLLALGITFGVKIATGNETLPAGTSGNTDASSNTSNTLEWNENSGGFLWQGTYPPGATDASDPGVTEGTESTDGTENTEATETPATEDATEPSTEATEAVTPPTTPTVPEGGTEAGTEQPSTSATEAPTTPPTEPHKHSYKRTVVSATCTKEGKRVFTCACGDSYSEKIAMKAHSFVVEEEKLATVMEKGYRKNICHACGTVKEEELDVLLPHLQNTAAAKEYCGDSLYGKVLPSVPNSTLYQRVFDTILNAQEGGTVTIYLPGKHVPDYPETYIDTEKNYWHDSVYRYIELSVEHVWLSEFDAPPGTTRITFEYTAAQAEYLRDAQRIARRILNELGITEATTKLEAIYLFNEYICNRMFGTYEDANYGFWHSMTTRKGLCTNYSYLFQALCLEAGIDCHFYCCEDLSVNHAWNKVYFDDGSFLWVDVTWNDPTYIMPDGSIVDVTQTGLSYEEVIAIRNKYLLIDTETLLKDHGAQNDQYLYY